VRGEAKVVLETIADWGQVRLLFGLCWLE
jgi:hypothetical protein